MKCSKQQSGVYTLFMYKNKLFPYILYVYVFGKKASIIHYQNIVEQTTTQSNDNHYYHIHYTLFSYYQVVLFYSEIYRYVACAFQILPKQPNITYFQLNASINRQFKRNLRKHITFLLLYFFYVLVVFVVFLRTNIIEYYIHICIRL